LTTVVSDTSPINYLVLIETIDVLPKLFDEVIIPPAVAAELQHPRTPQTVRDWIANLPPWARIQSPSRVDATMDLGKGETEAISLAVELGIHAVLIDEKRGRLAARERGLVPVGTLNILNAADLRGLIDFAQAIAKLRQTTFRADSKLLNTLIQDARTRKGSG